LSLTLEVLRIAQALVLIFGLVVVYYAAKSYRRTKSKSMLLLALGFGITTVGSVVGGVAYELMGAGLEDADMLYAVAQAVGFFIILLSLAVTKD
jgi:uncharacterized membrane protein